MNKRNLALAGLIALAAASRLLQDVNIAPITAIAIFAGIQFKTRRAAVFAVLAARLATDLGKEWLYRQGLAVHPGIFGGMWYVYGATALVALLAHMACGSRSPAVIGTTTLAGSCLFFLVTNFAVWVGSTRYPQTMEGLLMSYTMGIPFFRYSLLGDMAFVAVLTGAWAVAGARYPALEGEPEPTAA
jgi:hypothetical protein